MNSAAASIVAFNWHVRFYNRLVSLSAETQASGLEDENYLSLKNLATNTDRWGQAAAKLGIVVNPEYPERTAYLIAIGL